jgi:predicted secreted protein
MLCATKSILRSALLCLAALSASCALLGGQGERVEINLDQQAVAKVEIQTGDTLVLDVRNPGAGGYQFAGAYFDPVLLKLTAHHLIPPERAKPGNFGRATFEFAALKEGQSMVIIKIHRPWEDAPPEQYKSVQVTVTP